MLEQLVAPISGYFSIQMLGIILAVVALEAVLSADNAVALAALVQDLGDAKLQQQALNWGLAGAFILRITLLCSASWMLQFWQFELAGALYLLWLAGKHFWAKWSASDSDQSSDAQAPALCSLRQTIALIAITDLAFSIDSVTTAVALSSEVWIVLTGGLVGVLTLRFLAGLFVGWLTKFSYLQDAAYLTVMGVGIRLFTKAILPGYVLPEWMALLVIAVLFSWGFSKRAPELVLEEQDIR